MNQHNLKNQIVKALFSDDSSRWKAPVAVGIFAAFVLFVFYFILQPTRIHVSGFEYMLNDQVEYITTARNLLEHGQLQSNLIYISTLKEGAYRHFPGHATMLAASYGMFGYGVWSSLLPSLIGFVLTVVGVFLIGRQLFSWRVGGLAAILTMLFAPLLIFSFTAMAEMTFVAAGILAGFGFILTYRRYGFWMAPVFLVIPFVFRETGSMLVLVMVSLAGGESLRAFGKKALPLFVLSVVGLIPVYLLVRGGGGTAFFLANFMDLPFDEKYRNAFHVFPSMDFSTVIEVLGEHIAGAGTTLLTAFKFSLVSFEAACLTSMAILILLSLSGLQGRGLVRRFSVGVFALGVAVVALLLSIYQVGGWVGLRMLLFVFPWLAIGLSAVIFAPDIQRPIKNSILVLALIATLSPMLFCGQFSRALKQQDEFDDRNVEFIESLKHDDSTVLFSSVFISMNYVLQHYPVRWSFEPLNDETWRYARETLPVGTLILRKAAFEEGLHREVLLDKAGAGFDGPGTPKVTEVRWLDADLEVFHF